MLLTGGRTGRCVARHEKQPDQHLAAAATDWRSGGDGCGGDDDDDDTPRKLHRQQTTAHTKRTTTSYDCKNAIHTVTVLISDTIFLS